MDVFEERIPEPIIESDLELEEVSPDFFGTKGKEPIEEPEVDFSRLDLRVGQIRDARCHPCLPDLLYLTLVDVGEAWGRPVGVKLVEDYELRELENRMVVLLCNVEMSWSRGIECDGVLMGATDQKSGKIELLDPPRGAKIGDLIYVDGYNRGVGNKLVAPGDPRGLFHKIVGEKLVNEFYVVGKYLQIDKDRQATYKGLPLRVEGKKGAITTKTLSQCPITAIDCDEELY